MEMVNNINDKLKQAIREAVRDGIEEALTKYGVDTSNPNSMQADLIHLRKSRLGSDELAKWIKRSIITVAITSLLATLWSAIKQSLANH
jgi:hypothetical protein